MAFSIPFVLLSSELHPCPPETFYWGPLGAGSETAGIMLLIAASFAWLGLCIPRARGQSWARFTWTVPLFYLSGGLALFGLLFCAYGMSTWFCATSRDVLVRPPLHGSSRTMSWDDIRVVSAECTTTKNDRYGYLVLQWADGTKLDFPLADKGGVNRPLYERMQAMMANRQYDYRGLPDMALGRCPPGAPGLFTHFRR
jgi:hypothetical protein